MLVCRYTSKRRGFCSRERILLGSRLLLSELRTPTGIDTKTLLFSVCGLAPYLQHLVSRAETLAARATPARYQWRAKWSEK